jgi:rfaE bifunctional protein nucleotidyltransferase chain/domain
MPRKQTPTVAHTHGKIKTLKELAAVLAPLRRHRKIVHCHGVFDLIHIGHIRHFQAARRYGDLLVVTVTPDRFVNKGPHRPVFNEHLRAEAVAALDCVDFVAINCWPTAVEAIGIIKPHFYVKGAEYRDARRDVTGGITAEAGAVAAGGGRLVFTDDIVFSSTNLVNRHLSTFPQETRDFLKSFGRRYRLDDVLRPLQDARRLKVLVVGETIIDEYSYCETIGKSSKSPTLVVKQFDRERFAGGILAIANHVADFCRNVGLVSFLGTAPSQEDFIRSKLKAGIRPKFLYRRGAPTIVKRRYLDHYYFLKLLEVYEIEDSRMPEADERRLCAVLDRELPKYDAVIVADYGHEMLGDEAVKIICRKSRFLAVNAQSNAGNIGYHTIGRYRRPDFACLTEAELRMETRDRRGDIRRLLERFSRRMGFRKIIATRGKNGCICYDADSGFTAIPSFAGTVVDRVGAGDTFLSLASLCLACQAPMEVAGFVGNAAAAESVATVCNRSFIAKAGLIKHIESLIK